MNPIRPFVVGDTVPIYILRLPAEFDPSTRGLLTLSRADVALVEIDGYVSPADPTRMFFSPTLAQSLSLTEGTYRVHVRLYGPIVQTPVSGEILTVLRSPASATPN